MFKKTRARLRAAFESIVFVLSNLTASIEALRVEQSALRETLTAIEQNTRFLADAKRAEHQRQGHRIR